MAKRRYRILFAEDPVKLEALIAQPQYEGWTFFENPLSFSELKADHNYALVPPDMADLWVYGNGVFTVGFAPD
jgi:hypothetical protein